MVQRHRRWLSEDAPSTFPLSTFPSPRPSPLPRFPGGLPVHAVFSFHVVSSAACFTISLSTDWYLEKGMAAVYSLDEGELPSSNGLGPRYTYSGRKTLLGLLLSVRMKDRSYLQATPVNGRWESEQEGKKKREKKERKKERKKKRKKEKSWQGWKEQTRQIAPRDEATIRFSLSVSWSKPFLFSPSRAVRLCAPFPCNSLVSSRRSFLVRHTICSYEENVPVKWKRGSSIHCRTCRQRDQLGKLFVFHEML